MNKVEWIAEGMEKQLFIKGSSWYEMTLLQWDDSEQDFRKFLPGGEEKREKHE